MDPKQLPRALNELKEVGDGVCKWFCILALLVVGSMAYFATFVHFVSTGQYSLAMSMFGVSLLAGGAMCGCCLRK